MSNTKPTTIDVNRLQLRLADGIIVTPVRGSATVRYRVQVEATRQFFLFGRVEYFVLSLIDGRRRLAEIVTLAARHLGRDALRQHEAEHLCLMLMEARIAEAVVEPGTSSSSTTVAAGSMPAARNSLSAPTFSLFSIRLPLLAPDALLDRLLPWLGWMFSVPAMVCWLVLAAAAAFELNSEWDQFQAGDWMTLSLGRAARLLAAWILLKVLHEFSHALACRRHGGSVREMGLQFILLAPTAFVDVTSVWAFRSRWHRVQVAAAGVYAEVFVACLAVLAWSRTENAVLADFLQSLIVMAGATTFLFNLNPLLRLDGYYILSDLSGMPNLGPRATAVIRRGMHRLFFATPLPLSRESSRETMFLGIYGVLAILCQFAMSVGLMIFAATMFRGAGVIFAVAAATAWLVTPLLQGLRTLLTVGRLHPRGAARAVCVTSLIGVVLVGLWHLPCPWNATAPGVIQFTDSSVVRAGASGFCRRIAVRENEIVTTGTVLFELQNDELVAEVARLKLAIQIAEQKRRCAFEKGDIADAETEAGNRNALQQRWNERWQQQQQLAVRAAVDGRVIGRNLTKFLGTYVTEGAPLCTIGNETNKEFTASLLQDDRSHVAEGDTVRVRIGALPALSAKVHRISPQAVTKLPHPALSAAVGGPLSVRPLQQELEHGDNEELTEARFVVTAQFDSTQSDCLAAGELGQLAMTTGDTTLGGELWKSAHHWFQQRWQDASEEH